MPHSSQRSTFLVEVPKETLERLVSSLQGFWDDHKFAQKPDNPGWTMDEKAIETAREVLRSRRGRMVDGPS